MRKKCENLRKMIPKRVEGQSSAGYAKGAQEGEALPKRGLVHELVGIVANTLGGGPPRIVTLREAKRSSAGVLILKNYQAGLCNKVSRPSLLYLYQACVTNCPGHFLKVPAPSKIEQNLPTTFQNPPQTLPKSTQNRSKWLLGAYLGPMF